MRAVFFNQEANASLKTSFAQHEVLSAAANRCSVPADSAPNLLTM
jgi:hypothetical protein